MKRSRLDGHLSKEEYQYDLENSAAQSPGTFLMATPSTLASRRIVIAQRKDKKEQFIKHVNALNKSFHKWFKDSVKSNKFIGLIEGFKDYVDHISALEDRYLRTYGEVLTFGSGDCGQLAHGVEEDEDLMVKYPRIVYSLRDKKVCGISCGALHNAVFTENGQVYTWGCADDGSLGRAGDESIPYLVEGLKDETIIGVACGGSQTMAVSTKGEVWGWGCYKDKEGKKWFNSIQSATSIKDIKRQSNEPIKIPQLSNIVELACGSACNLAKTASGLVYSWGLGESGELGRFAPPMRKKIGEELEYDFDAIYKHHILPGNMYFAPQDNHLLENSDKNIDSTLELVKNVKSFGCGAYHCLLSVVGDRVYGCGLNNYGQLGQEDSNYNPRYYLVPIKGLEDKGIVCLKGGFHHSLVLSSSGNIYTFGRGDSGQLGSSDVSTSTAGASIDRPTMPNLPDGTKVKAIDCGDNHNLALTESDEVYTWGYGDMLALGHGEEKDELLPKKINFYKSKVKNITVTQVAGGGQHSAIIGKVTST